MVLYAIGSIDEVSPPRLQAANESETLNDVYVNVNQETTGIGERPGLHQADVQSFNSDSLQGAIGMIPRTLFSTEHDIFRESVRRFVQTELAPHHEAWEDAGFVPREAWRAPA